MTIKYKPTRLKLMHLTLAGSFALSICGNAWADALLDKAAQLVKNDDAKAAYALLEPQESNRAGDVGFDLLFAQSALEVGQNTRAVFALERVLAQQPNHTLARAEIARAYLAMGETEHARNEFKSVKEQGVPESVRRTIDAYLSAVDRLDADSKTSIQGYIEGSFGYDTNVNVAPNKNGVAIPGFGGLPFELSPSSKAAEDWFTSIGGGAQIRSPITRNLALIGSFSGTQRWNQHWGQFDTLNADASVGAIYTQQRDVYSFNLQSNSISVENNRFRETTGFSTQWQRNLDGRNQVSGFLQYGDMKYIGQPVRNAERWVAGLGYAHATREGTVGFGSAYLVKEDTQSGNAYLGLEGVGMRFGTQVPLTADTSAFGLAGIEWRWHDGVDPAFLLTRSDQQANLGAGIVHQLKRDLKLTGQYSWVENRSNVELNQYRRDMVTVTLRQDF